MVEHCVLWRRVYTAGMRRIHPIATFCLLWLLAAAGPASAAPEASILNPSGLPIPRFVSLKSDEVNARVGPGKRYPIRWVYHRVQYPVEIVEEFAHWRKIRDYEGSSGWVHKTMVESARSAIVTDNDQYLYAEPKAESKPVLRVARGVIGTLQQCTPDWCQMTINGRKAWARKSDIWGVRREEVFEH